CQFNVGSYDAVDYFIKRVTNPRRAVPVYTVGVGEYRQPASIRLEELQVPETARPDDKFMVRVPVFGPGLDNEEFEVTLDATRVEDAGGKPVSGEKAYLLPAKKGAFKGGGDL